MSEVVNMSALTLKKRKRKITEKNRRNKQERKIIEKNRRNQMKLLYSRLFSLIPPHITSKGGDQVADRVDRAIDYIQTLKTNLETNKNKRDKLLREERSHQHPKITNACISVDIQIFQMTHDLDAVLVTGLENQSSFRHVVKFLDQFSTEVTFASFSSSRHSIFHIRHKMIEAEEICKRLRNLFGNKELGDNDNANASFCNDLVESDLSIWDFDFQSDILVGWELEMFPDTKIDIKRDCNMVI